MRNFIWSLQYFFFEKWQEVERDNYSLDDTQPKSGDKPTKKGKWINPKRVTNGVTNTRARRQHGNQL
jgi:hypothetical protein